MPYNDSQLNKASNSMTVNNYISKIDNKTFNRIRNSKSDAECRRYLKELFNLISASSE